MTRRIALVCVALALVSAASVPAHAVDAPAAMPIGNGDRVSGTLDAPASTETFYVFLPAEAVLRVSAKGVRTKGVADVPVITFSVLDASNADLAAGALRPRGRTGSKARMTIPVTGLHRVAITADVAGDYALVVRWKSRTKFSIRGSLPAQGEDDLQLPFDIEPGSSFSAKVAPGKGSGARPRLDAALVGAATTPIEPPRNAATKKHAVRKIPFAPGSSGSGYVRIVNATSVAGDVTCKLVVHPPKASRRRLGLTDRDLGVGDFATGQLVTHAGGTIEIDDAHSSGLGGAMLDVPANALTRSTACFIGTAPDLALEDEELEGAGPTVHFGPSGLTFNSPVTLTLPFDPGMFPDGTDALRVYVRDRKGHVDEVPRGPGFVVDADSATVSFAHDHFSSYRVFGPSPPRSTMTAWIDGSQYDIASVEGGSPSQPDFFWHHWNRDNLSVNAADAVPYAPLPGSRLETNFNFQFEIAGLQIPPLPRRWEEPVISMLITQMIMDSQNQVVDTFGWDTIGQPFEMTVTFWDGTTMAGTFSGMARSHFGVIEVVPVSGEFSFIVPR